jgi:hypothetical protein
MCRQCGLSHRVKYDGHAVYYSLIFCFCGAAPNGTDLHFSIGTVDAWRVDQSGQTMKLHKQGTVGSNEAASVDSFLTRPQA